MVYLKIVYRPLDKVEYVRLDGCANIASFLCAKAIDNDVSMRDILCQVMSRKEFNQEAH